MKDKKLPTANCQLPTAFADEITIRTIVTPIGSQSEKWGAAGLMVCIGGETIPNGGCGVDAFSNPILSGFKMKENGTKEDVTGLFKVNDIVIFKDTHENHQYDYDSGDESDSDTVYEVRGSGVSGGCPAPFIATPYDHTCTITCNTICSSLNHTCAFGQSGPAPGRTVDCSATGTNWIECYCCND